MLADPTDLQYHTSMADPFHSFKSDKLTVLLSFQIGYMLLLICPAAAAAAICHHLPL